MAKDKEKKNSNKPGKFAGIKSELKRVSYPTAKQVRKNTGVVLVVLIMLAVFIFILDSALGFLTSKVLNLPSWNNPTEQVSDEHGDHYHYVDVNGVVYEDMGDGTFAPITEEGLGTPVPGDEIQFVNPEDISGDVEPTDSIEPSDNADETQTNEEE